MVTTRDSILNAAVEEFASQGLAGGRVDRIARASGFNKRMIYHYFGNKENLFMKAAEYVSADRRIALDTVVRMKLWQLLSSTEPLAPSGPDQATETLHKSIERQQQTGQLRHDVDSRLIALLRILTEYPAIVSPILHRLGMDQQKDLKSAVDKLLQTVGRSKPHIRLRADRVATARHI